MRKIIALIIMLPSITIAGQVVDQGQSGAPWRMAEYVNVLGKSSVVCVTNAAGGTTITNLAGRKMIEIQNQGPNPIFCTIDGQAPASNGTLGRQIGIGLAWSFPAGDKITIKCIALTAAQVAGACTSITEAK